MQFEAEVRQVKSMVDGSVNVTFNLPEYHVSEAQQLMAMIGDMVRCDVIADDKQSNRILPQQMEARRKRQS